MQQQIKMVKYKNIYK